MDDFALFLFGICGIVVAGIAFEIVTTAPYKESGQYQCSGYTVTQYHSKDKRDGSVWLKLVSSDGRVYHPGTVIGPVRIALETGKPLDACGLITQEPDT